MHAWILAIARFTVLEAARTRLLWLVAAGMACAVAVALGASALAIAEAEAIRAALLGTGLRLFAVLLIALFVAGAMVRETADKGVDLVLAMPVPRAVYYLGKLAGFACVACALAVAAAAVAALVAPLPDAAAWGAALACELVIVAAVALLCVLTFTQVPAALSAVAVFYLFARAVDTLLLMAHGPVIPQHSLGDVVMVRVLETLAWFVPHLGRFAPSDWLVYGAPGWPALAVIGAQTVLFVTLAAAATLFDLYRKNF